MPRKVLDKDWLRFYTMMICHKLGKTEQEVGSWELSDLIRWVAYFRLIAKAEKKAAARASKSKSSGRREVF